MTHAEIQERLHLLSGLIDTMVFCEYEKPSPEGYMTSLASIAQILMKDVLSEYEKAA